MKRIRVVSATCCVFLSFHQPVSAALVTGTRKLLLLFTLLFSILLCPYSSLAVGAADLDVYTDGLATGWENWSWGSTINLANGTPVHGGTDSIAVSFNGGWSALYLHLGDAVSLSGYEYLAFWIHGGSAGGQRMNVVGEQDGQSYSVTAQANAWTEVKISLSDLGNPAVLSDLFWQDATGGAQPVFYLDNIRFLAGTSGSSGPSASSSTSIYTDSLATGWQNWSWGSTIDMSNSSPVHGGSTSISVRFDGGWSALYLHTDDGIDLRDYQELRFWIHGGSFGGQRLSVVGEQDGQSYSATAQANTWTEVKISLSDLGNPSVLSDLFWQDATGGPQPVFYLDDISLLGGPPPPAGEGPALSIDVGTGRHAISEDIYGMNWAGEELAAELRLPVRRWGGNRTSRYNWQTGMSNTASDWFFWNILEGQDEGAVRQADGSRSDLFVEQNIRTGTKSFINVPLLGWVAKPSSPTAAPHDCGFKVSKYGPQQDVDEQGDPDCGNGRYPDGTEITGNDPADTSITIDGQFIAGWIDHLTGKYGSASAGGVTYYNLGNEPMLWHDTHRDVHPERASYDEIRDQTYEFGAAVKAADPSAQTIGPALWGWCAYLYSAADGCGNRGPDYTSHGSQYFVPWYLRQMKAYEQQHGRRVLDYLDLHYYPQGQGLGHRSPAGNSSTQALRLRSTRSLWDPTYKDESWINAEIRLIPQMKEWVNDNYPGTKLAISEYSWGAHDHINGALTLADVLGILGREGVDLAALWGPPDSSDPGAYAFRMYRNFDGSGSGFGDMSVSASSVDQERLSVYAAQRNADHALTIMAINKVPTDLTSALTLRGFTPEAAASVYRYSAEDLRTIEHPPAQALDENGFSATFPGNSITLFVVTPKAGADCAATLSGDLSLHIPVISYVGSSYLWADFKYIPDTMQFSVTDAGVVADPSRFVGCSPATLSAGLGLHIPAITFEGASLWADFAYSHDLVFTLTGAGVD